MPKKRGKYKKYDAAAEFLKRRAHFERTACSSSWAESLASGRETLPEGLTTCGGCLRGYPPIYCNGDTCFDCHLAALSESRVAALPPSSSIIRGA